MRCHWDVTHLTLLVHVQERVRYFSPHYMPQSATDTTQWLPDSVILFNFLLVNSLKCG